MIVILFISSGVVAGLDLKIQNLNEQNGDEEIDWWPMFQHDPGRTGYSSSHGPETNQTLWKIKGHFSSFPVVINSKVYIGGYYSELFCFDVDTGNELWNYSTDYWGVSSPAVYDGKIFFNSCDRYTYCLDEVTGEKIWQVKTGDAGYVMANGPVVINDKVYVSTDKIYCLDAKTGEEIWSNTSGLFFAVEDNRLFSVRDSINKQNVFCIDAENGEIIWSLKLYGGVYAPPTVSNGKLYVGAGRSDYCNIKIFCLDAKTGIEYWNQTIKESKIFTDSITCSPAVCNDKVIVGSEIIHCLNVENGKEIWNYTTAAKIKYSSPAICDGKIYICDLEGGIYCLNLENGNEIWKYKTDLYIQISPAVANGKLYVASLYWLYCFTDQLIVDIERKITGRITDVKIENPSEYSSTNVTYTISIKGGLLGLIDYQFTNNFSNFDPGKIELVNIYRKIFGFGKITIHVIADAENIDPFNKEYKGFIIGIFIFITN